MEPDDDELTFEALDEHIDALTWEPRQLPSGGRQTPTHQLIQRLHHLYHQEQVTAQSVDAVWQRLIDSDSVPDEPPRQPIPLPPSRADRKKTWQQHLSALMAAVVMLALVSTLSLLFLQRHQGPGGATPPANNPPARSWQLLAHYTGVGFHTITGQHLQLPPLWGEAFACFGKGDLGLEINGPYFFAGPAPVAHCQLTPFTLSGPQSMVFDLMPSAEIQTLDVTADSNTSWSIQYFEMFPQPTFTLGRGWVMGGGDNGGSGAFQIETNTTLLNGGVGQPLRTQNWGVVFVCTGSGTGTIHFFVEGSTASPDKGGISAPPCDGQPRLLTIHYPVTTAIQSISITMRGTVLWNAQEVACVDKSRC